MFSATALLEVLIGAFSWLSPASTVVIEALITVHGHARPAAGFAVIAGYTNRYALARQLAHDGLPPLRELAAWIKVLLWLREAEAGRTSLYRLALDDHDDPATSYRLVHRISGLTWIEAKREGFGVMLVRFVDHCRARRAAIEEQRAASA